MRNVKLFLFCLGIFSVLIVLIRFFVRQPSYTICTSGTLYIVNKGSEDVTVFDLHKGKEITEIPVNVEAHNAIAIQATNTIVVANYGTSKVKNKSLTFINTATNTIDKTRTIANNYFGLDGIAVPPKRNKLGIISSISNTLIMVDADSGKIDKMIPTQQLVSHLVVFHPNKSIAYVTNIRSASVSVISLIENKVTDIIPCGQGTHGIAITPDGKEVWATNTLENTISVISTINNKVITTLAAGSEPLNLKFSNDGKYCLVANSIEGTLSVYNQKTKLNSKTIVIPGKKKFVERLLYHTPRPVNILMHPNGLYAFVANSNANKIEVIDMKTFEIVSTIGTGEIPDALAFVK